MPIPSPTDPLYPAQGHLFDINAPVAWTYATGRGVRLAMIDSGFDSRLPDLRNHFDAASSWDFVYGDADPTFTGWDGVGHGSLTSGLALGAMDGVGGVGVAFDATHLHYRLSFPAAGPDQYLAAAAFNKALEAGADIVNASWGYRPFTDGVGGIGQAAAEAAVHFADQGRGGLGGIFVSASGNTSRSSSTDILLKSDPHFVVVGGSYSNGPAYVTTGGASVLIAAPSTNILMADAPGPDGYSDGDTHRGTGSSYAAPIAAGTVALMLDANPGLGGRDVQEILAKSANPFYRWVEDSALNAGQDWNGGGQRHNWQLGYGLLDAAAAVRMAESWFADQRDPATFTNWLRTTSNVDSAERRYDESPTYWADNSVDSTLLVADNIEVEAVRVTARLDPASMFTSSLYLRSPAGTLIQIGGLPANADVSTAQDYASPNGVWTFTAQGLRGESSAGDWTVMAVDRKGDRVGGLLADVSIEVLGRQAIPDDRYVYTDALKTALAADPERRLLADADGGHDALDISATATPAKIDLDGTVQLLAGTTIHLAPETAIENAIGSAGDDVLLGSTQGNILWGNDGADIILGKGGNDLLRGGRGDDILIGGSGADIAYYKDAAVTAGRTSWGGVVINAGDDGIDLLQGVETLAFGATLESPYAATSTIATASLPTIATIRVIGPTTYTGTLAHEDVRALYAGTTLTLSGGLDRFFGNGGHDIVEAGWLNYRDIAIASRGAAGVTIAFHDQNGAPGITLLDRNVDAIHLADGIIQLGQKSSAAVALRLAEALTGDEVSAAEASSWAVQLRDVYGNADGLAHALLATPEVHAHTAALDDQGYVTLLFEEMLSRAPSDLELNSFLAPMLAGTLDRAGAAATLASSALAANQATADVPAVFLPFAEELAVRRLYAGMLGRDPEAHGLDYWVSSMRFGGLTDRDLATGIANSEEFGHRAANQTADDLLVSLYDTALHRAPDEGGRAFWLHHLTSGVSPAEVAHAISNSPEAILLQATSPSFGADGLWPF